MEAAPEARGVARYRELFANQYAASLLAWSIVARLPTGMAGLALVLLVRGEGASYGEAGLVAAAYGIAVAIGAPYGGRRVDRRGARLVLRRRMIIYPSLFGVVAVLGAVEAPIAAIARRRGRCRADDAARSPPRSARSGRRSRARTVPARPTRSTQRCRR